MQTGKMPAQGSRVVVVVVVVAVAVVELVVDEEDVDVVGQARQQLPLSAVPRATSHRADEGLMRQRWPPPATVCRHAAAPGLPHVERDAHLTTAPLHSPGSAFSRTRSLATRETHWT